MLCNFVFLQKKNFSNVTMTTRLNEHDDPQEAILSRNVSKRQIDEGKQTRQTFHNHKSSQRGTVTLAFNIQPDRQNEKCANGKFSHTQ